MYVYLIKRDFLNKYTGQKEKLLVKMSDINFQRLF